MSRAPEKQPLRVVVAPDSFKGSLTAIEVADATAEGVRRAAPHATVLCIPMSDGGDGSLQVVLRATGAQHRLATVLDANGRPCQAAWALLDEQTAFIEMAQAAGLDRIAAADRRPLQASTYGVGQLVLQALDAGVHRIVMGLGGSATTDGGAGMLQALGMRLIDSQGADLPPGGGALRQLAQIDNAGVDPRLAHVRFQAAVDVDNPLCGSLGAAPIYGPQKGASAEDVQALDEALARFAHVSELQTGRNEADTPGSGAAGGLGFALKSFLAAEFRVGVELIAELVGLEPALQEAHLVFTGEGRLDAQTFTGKTPAGVAKLAKRKGADVVVLVGALERGYQNLYDWGVTAAFSVISGPMDLETAQSRATELIRDRAHDCMSLWLAGQRSKA